MQKLKTTKRAVALLLCAVLLCFPLMGLVAPAAQAGKLPLDGGCVITCYCTVHCAGEHEEPLTAPGCQTDISARIRKSLAVSAPKKCTPEQINESRPACVLPSALRGQEPEPAPVCSQ